MCAVVSASPRDVAETMRALAQAYEESASKGRQSAEKLLAHSISLRQAAEDLRCASWQVCLSHAAPPGSAESERMRRAHAAFLTAIAAVRKL